MRFFPTEIQVQHNLAMSGQWKIVPPTLDLQFVYESNKFSINVDCIHSITVHTAANRTAGNFFFLSLHKYSCIQLIL